MSGTLMPTFIMCNTKLPSDTNIPVPSLDVASWNIALKLRKQTFILTVRHGQLDHQVI